jgi:hypothetical protein
LPVVFAFWYQYLKKNEIMDNYLKNWNFMRLLRLALGIIIMVQGALSKEWIFVAMGALLTLMPLLNMGCCSTSGCNTPIAKSNKKTNDITYEELP